MSDEPENLTLIYLRRLEAKMDRIIEDNVDSKVRMNRMDTTLANMQREAANLYGVYAELQVHLTRIDTRLDRIERRLDLYEPVR